MHWKRVPLMIVLGGLSAIAQTGASGKNSAQGPAAAVPKVAATTAADAEKTTARPKSYDLSAMDKNVDPCDNFYEYACGTWRKNNPIPSDQSRWGRFNELADYNRQFLHNILEKASANNPKRTPVMQKVGDMYQSCMDEAAANSKGVSPLKPELDRIAAMLGKQD